MGGKLIKIINNTMIITQKYNIKFNSIIKSNTRSKYQTFHDYN